MDESEQSQNTLDKARFLQTEILEKTRGEQSDFIDAQKTVLADICFEIAKLSKAAGDVDKSMQYYNLAVRSDNEHEPSLLALARSYLKSNELVQCQESCTKLLRHDPSNQEASIMLADIMFQKCDYESAVHQFKEVNTSCYSHNLDLSVYRYYKIGPTTSQPLVVLS